MSYNRPQLSGFSGTAQIYRQVAIKTGAYTAAAGDDLIISNSNVTLFASPEPGDVVQVFANGAGITVSGNGNNINGASSVSLTSNQIASFAFDGVKWIGGTAAASA